MIGEDGAELERERVERSAELLRGEQQRRGEAGVVPGGDARGARAQVVGRQASTTASVGVGSLAASIATATAGEPDAQVASSVARVGISRARSIGRTVAFQSIAAGRQPKMLRGDRAVELQRDARPEIDA